MSTIAKLISCKKAKVCVLGLGYVGLPIAVAAAKNGFFTYGLDNSASRIARLEKGVSYITDVPSDALRRLLGNRFHPTTDGSVVANSDVIVICVPTPLKRKKIPDVSYIVKAIKVIARHLRKDQLIILESTTYPGTTDEVARPILEKTGMVEGKDFFLAFSPERIDPSNKRYRFSNIPKVVGGVSKKAQELACSFYAKIVKKVIPVSSARAAESVKLLENTFRIVNIGLANEFAMLCDKLDLDVWEIIEAAKTKPFGFMPFYPGPGIGGHCIPADPIYLSWKAKKAGFRAKMIDLAAKTNNFMPYYVSHRIEALAEKTGKFISNTKVLILGVTYKKDVKDLRESPALEIIEILRKKGFKVSYADPHIPYLDINNINLKSSKLTPANIKKYDILVLATAHSRFNYKNISKSAKVILDTRNAFAAAGIRADNIIKL